MYNMLDNWITVYNKKNGWFSEKYNRFKNPACPAGTFCNMKWTGSRILWIKTKYYTIFKYCNSKQNIIQYLK